MQSVKGDYSGYYPELGGIAGQLWTGPPGWELGEGRKTCYVKNLTLRKPKLCPRNSQTECNRLRHWKRINTGTWNIISAKVKIGKRSQKTELTSEGTYRGHWTVVPWSDNNNNNIKVHTGL
jgi:hypothetical protein